MNIKSAFQVVMAMMTFAFAGATKAADTPKTQSCAHDYSGVYMMPLENACDHNFRYSVPGLFLVPNERNDKKDGTEVLRLTASASGPGFLSPGQQFVIRQITCTSFEFETVDRNLYGDERIRKENINFIDETRTDDKVMLSKNGAVSIVRSVKREGYTGWGLQVTARERGSWEWSPTTDGFKVSGHLVTFGEESFIPFMTTNFLNCRYVRLNPAQ